MSKGAIKTCLPRLIEPGKLAQQCRELVGLIPSESLPRVLDACQTVSDVECHLQFRVDEQYRRLVEGRLVVDVQLICQRCLNNIDLHVDAPLKLAFVQDEDKASSLPKNLDFWLLAEAETSLYELVEEEILLNIPNIIRHDYACSIAGVKTDSGVKIDAGVKIEGDALEEDVRKVAKENQSEGKTCEKPGHSLENGNPFQALKDLKKSMQGKTE